MTPSAARAVTRRYHLLLALRFVPTGLSVTVFVLLLQDRGLSLGQIGLAGLSLVFAPVRALQTARLQPRASV